MHHPSAAVRACAASAGRRDIRIRPHLTTPRGNYYTSAVNGMVVKVDGNTATAYGSSIRVIVDD